MMEKIDLMMKKLNGQERVRKEKGMAENSPEPTLTFEIPTEFVEESMSTEGSREGSYG